MIVAMAVEIGFDDADDVQHMMGIPIADWPGFPFKNVVTGEMLGMGTAKSMVALDPMTLRVEINLDDAALGERGEE